MIKGAAAFILSKSYTDKHGGGGGGTSDYNSLSNRPKINHVTLANDHSSSDLKLVGEGDQLTSDQMAALIGLL